MSSRSRSLSYSDTYPTDIQIQGWYCRNTFQIAIQQKSDGQDKKEERKAKEWFGGRSCFIKDIFQTPAIIKG
jgi:hypothetical protein